MSRSIVISDLHLTGDKRIDNFGLKKIPLFEKLIVWCIQNKITRIIFGGDLWELGQGEGWSEKKRLKYAKNRYYKLKAILNSLSTIDVIYISGNHDEYCRHIGEAQEKYVIDENGMKVCILHGHQFDDFFISEDMRKFSRVATEFWGVVETTIGTKSTNIILNWIEKLIEDYKNYQYRKKLKKFGNSNKRYSSVYSVRALEYAKENKYTHIVIGHTHRECVEENFADSGCWIDNDQDFILIDTGKKKISLGFVNSGGVVVF